MSAARVRRLRVFMARHNLKGKDISEICGVAHRTARGWMCGLDGIPDRAFTALERWRKQNIDRAA